MTQAEHEARIDRMQHLMENASTPELRRGYCELFVAAIRERNAARTPEQVAELERARGLR
jgi:hypothetical protein